MAAFRPPFSRPRLLTLARSTLQRPYAEQRLLKEDGKSRARDGVAFQILITPGVGG
jgi:hypothetical protein